VDPTRVAITVTAGVLPGISEDEFTRSWYISSDEWDAAADRASELLAERNGQAQGYAALLMLRPDRVNWVNVEWLWM
jgi:hypothetical protein